ncbi:MAG: Ribosomal RNA small subunit methyltransferase H [Candidatus Tokpelaia hoelldobleri]|uniref:Ribosomal RNA small subunit methyltransferase H n=1 Tax=Candidatus Tokpelaia hoelldobleri TaxID=1902579 RepID=A0A1U9JVW0_9HYPH|nr:MAG: Ribosomal RNA small subunit methyltransferase H [Candidatus Tokpelaia hoelldoblerii]
MTQDEDRHIPVMLDEVVAALGALDGARVIDGTFGAGGYTRAFLARGACVIGLDRDPDAVQGAQDLVAQSEGRFKIVETAFSHLAEVSDVPVDAVVLDIGVSSMQIDEGERGFSFQKDGPLDMRMAQKGFSAADVVNRMKVADLARIFAVLGEERHAGRVARMIEARREQKPFTRTLDLARAIEALLHRKPGAIHPATRVFQALRIYVNDELGELGRALFAAERCLVSGGRLAVVTFHSLEDRMVKRFFAARGGPSAGSRHLPDIAGEAARFLPLFKGAQSAGEAEVARNPRARSARLRVGVRTDAPAAQADFSLFQLPVVAAYAGGVA